jgi:hypothetical protein
MKYLKQNIIAVAVLVLSFYSCSSDADELLTYEGGSITRGELRTFFRLRNKPLEHPSNSTQTQTKILKNMAINEMATIDLKKQKYDKIPEYQNVVYGTELTSQMKFLSIQSREEIKNSEIDLYQLQILFLKYPQNIYKQELVGDIELKDIPENPRIYGKGQIHLYTKPAINSVKMAKLTLGQEVKVLSKEKKSKKGKKEKVHWFKIKILKEGHKYSPKKGAKKKMVKTVGKIGYVFGNNLAYTVGTEEQEKKKTTFGKESEKIFAKMKTLSEDDLDLFIAEKTDEKSSQIYAGIKPFQARQEAEIPGNDRLKKVIDLQKGQFAKEPHNNGQGFELIYLRDRIKSNYNDIDDVMEDHFSFVSDITKEIGDKIQRLSKKAENALKRDPMKEAAKYANRLKSNIVRGGDRLIIGEITSNKKFKFKKDFDPKDKKALIMKSPKIKLRVNDLKSYFEKFYPDGDWDGSEKMTKSFGMGIGRALLFSEYFNTLTLSENEKKLYDSIFVIFMGEKNTNFYLSQAKPLDSIKIKEKELKENYEKFKNTRWVKKGKPGSKKKTPLPYKKVRDKILKQMQKRKQRQEHEKLKNKLYKKFKPKINVDMLKNGEI